MTNAQRSRRSDSVVQHDRIIALCAAGDARQAAAATRTNWQTLAYLIDDLDADGDDHCSPA
jgi:hypothetical protein